MIVLFLHISCLFFLFFCSDLCSFLVIAIWQYACNSFLFNKSWGCRVRMSISQSEIVYCTFWFKGIDEFRSFIFPNYPHFKPTSKHNMFTLLVFVKRQHYGTCVTVICSVLRLRNKRNSCVCISTVLYKLLSLWVTGV